MSFYYLQQDLNLTNQSSVERQMEFDNELEQDTDLAINILPMIDVLFAILLFFVISSLILNRNSMIGINRPQTSINTPIDKKAIVISANKEGEIYINKTKSGPSTLAEDLHL